MPRPAERVGLSAPSLSGDLLLKERLALSRGCLPAAVLCAALLVPGRSAAAEPPPPGTPPAETPPAETPPPPVGEPQPFPLVFGIFDLSGVHTFPASISGTSGSMSSTFVTGRIGPVFRVTPRLYMSIPLDGSVSFYEFRGDPGLLPGGRVPWDQVRTFAIGVQARYKIDDHWALLGEINGASAGARGAPFDDTLSLGGTFGARYRFGPELSVGLLLTVQTRLARSLFVLPVPTLEWVLPVDEGRFRLVAGGLRVGPGRTAGVGLVYTPVEAISLNLGIVLVGLGREFRLPSDSPIPSGVGRDNALPFLAGIDFRPTRLLHITLWGGVSVQRTISVLDHNGTILNERDVDPAGLLGGTVALGL